MGGGGAGTQEVVEGRGSVRDVVMQEGVVAAREGGGREKGGGGESSEDSEEYVKVIQWPDRVESWGPPCEGPLTEGRELEMVLEGGGLGWLGLRVGVLLGC